MTTLRKLDDLIEAELLPAEKQGELDAVAQNFSIAVTPQLVDLIDKNNVGDPIAKQFIPHVDELIITAEELEDPIGDQAHSPVKGIVHRYPDRCLLMPVNVCPVYCRFCFRREKVGPGNAALTPDQLEQALSYIESHSELFEVILSGGDPLILKPKPLQKIIERLNRIDHVEVIRIHTRVPVVDSMRINAEMLQVLSNNPKPIYVVLHANHAREFTKDAVLAIQQLIDAGVVMLSQSVLLAGVNDDIETLIELMRTFVRHRIKPYYLHQTDMAKGTGHFRVDIEKGRELMRELRQRISGICQPTYVLDGPDGQGKMPIISR